MTNYFHLDRTANTKKIGTHYPQCKGLINGYDNEAENSLYNFAHFKGCKVDFTPNLDGISIYKNSKLTDIISCSLGPGNDLIVSDKFYNVINSFKKGSIQFFDCYIYHEESRLKYNWVHFVYDLEKHVNYQASIFTHPDESLKSEIGNITSYSEFINFYEQKDKFGSIRAEKVVLNTTPLDFFVVGRYNQKTYISRKLRDALLNERITGIDINEINVDEIVFA